MGNSNLYLAEELDSLHGCASAYTCMFISSLDVHLYKLPHVKAEVDPCLWHVENWCTGENPNGCSLWGTVWMQPAYRTASSKLSEDNGKQNKLNRNWLCVPMKANTLSPKRLFSSNWWSFPRGQRGRKTVTKLRVTPRSDTWRWTSLSSFSSLCFPNLDKGFTSNNHGGSMLDF